MIYYAIPAYGNDENEMSAMVSKTIESIKKRSRNRVYVITDSDHVINENGESKARFLKIDDKEYSNEDHTTIVKNAIVALAKKIQLYEDDSIVYIPPRFHDTRTYNEIRNVIWYYNDQYTDSLITTKNSKPYPYVYIFTPAIIDELNDDLVDEYKTAFYNLDEY